MLRFTCLGLYLHFDKPSVVGKRCRNIRDRYIILSMWAVCVFFFQAEDGIRDVAVTGVQTCALPILPRAFGIPVDVAPASLPSRTGPRPEPESIHDTAPTDS